MTSKAETIKSLNAEKEKVIPTLYIDDSDTGRYGKINRKFFECTLKFRIWNEEPFSDDYLTLFTAKPRLQELGEAVGIWTVKVFRLHLHNESTRGFSIFEIDNRSSDGLTVERSGDKEITATEFQQKLKTHGYKVLQQDGTSLIPLIMYTSQ
jgi:hypothetical protein